MFLSKRSNGVYYLWFLSDGGKREKISTGCTRRSDALKFVRDLRHKEGDKRPELPARTLRSFYAEYLNFSKGLHTLKTQHSISNSFRELIRIEGDVRLDALGVRQIEHFLATKKAEASDWTARKYYIHLSSAFETAIRWEYLTSNPFRKVQKPKTAEVQPTYFTRVELNALIDVIKDEQYRNICLVAVLSGMRMGEILNLQWSDIDLVRNVIYVRNSEFFTTKTRKNRTLPISQSLSRLFIGLYEQRSAELVFHRKGKKLVVNDISRSFKAYIRIAGLREKLHFHSLRHTFATWLVQDGVSVYEVQKLLGHSSVKVTEIYLHLAASELHGAVDRIKLSFI